MRNPILHVFLYCEDLEYLYPRWPPDAIFKIYFNSLYAMVNYKICL